ncbi:DEAD/DEAH box helicase [Actinotignum sp. GS-2025b]|uniref:DEAD/DEAH box helicase n=1 Tax=Actinotignum sp. GS-2025b TaxID=3427275 RepID=UPI003F465263
MTDLLLEDYRESYASRGIHLDDFQLEACAALGRGHDVLVCAPTGSGKTVVAHYAVYLALASSKKCIYTAPIKALSNQKYAELAREIGEEQVGLLTGDQSINREAQILVVTTEVLRNMLLHESPDIRDVGYAVLDEVHFLADPDRGPVWEETILSLPDHVRLAALSATVANTEELAAWMRSVRGPTDVVVSTKRPVPLAQYVNVGRKLFPLYRANTLEPDPALVNALDRRSAERKKRVSDRERRAIIDKLSERGMLPAIEFIFSRKGCDKAVEALLRHNEVLTTRAQRAEIKQEIAALRETLTESDRRAVHFERAAAALERGYGAHHAGVFPAIKELTERLMERGLLSIVYATGTLALGIDMPVRTVVLEELQRWDGHGFVDLNATEYTQLIGRAGRRGRDTVGYGVVLADSETDPEHLADLASGRVEPLISAFQPSYNTVTNLLARMSYAAARDLMGRSFAQFQRNAELGGLAARRARIQRRVETEETRLSCSRGDLLDYLRLRGNAGRAAKAERKAAKRRYRERIAKSFAAVRQGYVYAYAIGTDLVYALVLSAAPDRVRVIDWFGDLAWLYEDSLASEMREIGPVTVPFGMSTKKPTVREQIAEDILDLVGGRADLGIDRDLLASWARFATPRDPKVAAHPVASCPHLYAHLDEAQTWVSLHHRIEEIDQRIAAFTDSAGREFDATAAVLREVGVLQGDNDAIRMGPGAAQLRELHTEADLLMYQCLAQLPEGSLDAPALAGWVSMFLADDRLGSALPREARLVDAARVARAEVQYLQSLELTYGITRTPDLSPGCADVFAAWAGGVGLEACLESARMTAGDFISAARRIIDVLGQVTVATEGTWLSDIARQARDLMRRSELM